MADGLHPTKTRLALLRAVERGEVVREVDSTGIFGRDDWDGETVTARISEMRAHGWVGEIRPYPRANENGVYPLTDEGRRILAEYGGQQ